MEPRARIGKNRGQQSFTDAELQHFLFAHGDTMPSLDSTKRVLDELLTDFITEICFEAHRSALLSGRQKIKVEDIKFAVRKNPEYLGKIEDISFKKKGIDNDRKIVDPNDDRIVAEAKSVVEEELGDKDDDEETRNVRKGKGKVNGKRGQSSGR